MGWKQIEEVYPDFSNYGASDYNPLLQSYGYDIILQVDDQGYEGDTRVIFRDGNRYGLLIFGWGSCSGCDALQACTTLQEVEELRKHLHDKIKWGTAAELLEYIENKDWELEWSWGETTKKFLEKAKQILRLAVEKQW